MLAWLRAGVGAGAGVRCVVTMRLSGAPGVLRGQLPGGQRHANNDPSRAKQRFWLAACSRGKGLPQSVLEGIRGQSPGNRQPAPTRSHSLLPPPTR